MFVRIHVETILRTKQYNFIAYRDTGQSGHIDERQIHGDAAHNRGIVLTHDHSSSGGKGAIQSVSVTNGRTAIRAGAFVTYVPP